MEKDIKTILNYVLENKVLTFFAFFLAIFFIYRAGKSVGEFLYYILN